MPVRRCMWVCLHGSPMRTRPATDDAMPRLHAQAMRGVLSADGALAAIATEAGAVQLWDVAAGQPLQVRAGRELEFKTLTKA